MFIARICLAWLFAFISFSATSQQTGKKKIAAKRINTPIVIDGEINEPVWKDAPLADNFIALRPTPFRPENPDNATQVYFLYDDEGIYVGGYLHESSRDSISHELVGRDGFGANDFIGVIFDTYYDKINGFEYFVTPLGEQMDAKQAPNPNGDSEDFGWNAVWQSGCKIHADGWSFEMFIPYAAIRFGKDKVQDWGLNIVRRRQKSGEQLFWQSIDPNVNGFLTQEGLLSGLENIKPPLRLQFSPYFSTYQNHDALAADGKSQNTTTFNGGMDIKYGLSAAFTLDMTLIPDFGQVQSDNIVYNLTPFEQKFSDNRPFFTEGTELFNKGNLFYSRRIPTKLFNATKISGRMQNGLGIGFLNAIAKPQYEVHKNSDGTETKVETSPLTNYNVFVLDKTMKYSSSVSLVNTNVLRSGGGYDANVTSALFDLYEKKNTWNINGSVSVSNLFGVTPGKTITGYAHAVYFGKVSGHFNFQLWQELTNAQYEKRDLGYFTNNNTMDQGFWMAYNWSKPTRWYNQFRINTNFFYSRLVSSKDPLNSNAPMYQNAGYNFNANGQLKNLWWVGLNINGSFNRNDFYEPHVEGRFFRDKPRIFTNIWWESNSAKKLSWGGNVSLGKGSYFSRTYIIAGLFGKIRFSSKFSVDEQLNIESIKNQPGFADIVADTVFFSRRNVANVENVFSAKYNFTNKMGISLRARHAWTKVHPQQFYELNKDGYLQNPRDSIPNNVNFNFNYLSVDLVYSWQFAQGSFINVVWKNIGSNSSNIFQTGYFANLEKTFSGNGFNNETQFSSLSLKVIYFLDYLTERNRLRNRGTKKV